MTSRPPLWQVFEDLLKVETDDCIVWPYSKNSKGYGKVRRPGGGPLVRVHVEACTRRHGPRPTGLLATHIPVACHNRACINYRHLRWATPTQNELDKRADGTDKAPRRQRSDAKLSEDDVRLIRALHADGQHSYSELARRFGVSVGMVGLIVTRRRWATER